MSPVFAVACLALVCGLWPSAHGLSFPSIIDDVAREFAEADRALKMYTKLHTERNKEMLTNELVDLKEVQADLLKTPVPGGLFTRLKQAFRPLIDELVNEIEGVLGITHSARSMRKMSGK